MTTTPKTPMSANKKLVLIVVGLVVAGSMLAGGGTKKAGSTTETDYCKDSGSQPYRGSADNDAVIQYLKECRGQTDEDIYGHSTTTYRYGY